MRPTSTSEAGGLLVDGLLDLRLPRLARPKGLGVEPDAKPRPAHRLGEREGEVPVLARVTQEDE